MRILLVVVLALVFTLSPISAFAEYVYCPVHDWASCYDTGKVSPSGSGARLYHCACGDDVWVK